MHIVDGALSNPVVIGGAMMAVAGIGMGLRRLDLERIPAAGVLSASFFVASLIHVPIGPSSVHLILNGLAGLVLGWAAFPALFVGLLLQAVFFGFGGLTVLGINTLNIALPAVLAWLLVGPMIPRGSPLAGAIWGGLGGALAIAGTTAMVALSLALSGDEFLPAARLVFVAHVPIMIIEGLLTGFAVLLARKVKPDLFTLSRGIPA
ncbi:MAG: cobalt transporter CbiM [Rhodobacteraceae bacterium]|nr:cobalt transporter CbiM [Paracoccaceae bacterium]MBR9821575.1 cobalt transporter CbiM [Paracoccaceae bacterium]